jgi:hypothetical protein
MNDLRGAFRILQVVTTSKTDTFSTSSTSFADITGLSVSITPSATSSLVLVFADVKLGGANGTNAGIQLMRDSTAIYIGNAAGSRIRATFGGNMQAGDTMKQASGIYVDSPNTTSATTYKVQIRTATSTVNVNRSDTDTDSASFYRGASSITVMEISA